MVRRKEIPNTKEEKIEVFNFKNSFIETAVNIHPTQEYKKLSLEEFYKIIFGRSLSTKFSEVYSNLANLEIPFQKNNEKSEEGKFTYNNIIIEIRDKRKHRNSKTWIVHKELDILNYLSNSENFLATAPLTYVGKNRNSSNARDLYALVIDLDYVYEDQIQYLLLKIQKNLIPMPNLIVNSGTGVHLYYILEKPIRLFKKNREILDELKEKLINKIWDSYTSFKGEEYRQYQNNIQGYRLPDSLTKFGEKTTCYLNIKSSYTNIHQLAKEVNFSDKTKELSEVIDNFVKKESERMKFVKENYPEWYEKVVINKEKVPEKDNTKRNKGLYNWWLRKIKEGDVKAGFRYNCALAAVAFATKSGIPRNQVKKDLLELIPYFDEMTIDEDNHFTKTDVMDALAIYGTKRALTYKKDTLQKLTGISFGEPKVKQGKTRVEQAEYMRYQFAIKKKFNLPMKKNGRPSRKEELKEFMVSHPDITKLKDISEISKISYITVKRHYKEIREEIAQENQLQLENERQKNNPFDL